MVHAVSDISADALPGVCSIVLVPSDVLVRPEQTTGTRNLEWLFQGLTGINWRCISPYRNGIGYKISLMLQKPDSRFRGNDRLYQAIPDSLDL